MIRYTTVKTESQLEQIVARSRFIAHVKPVSSKEEADGFISRIRSEYKDATHNVPVFVLGERMELQWASDDGEPQGTAGAPILQMLVKEGLTNLVCVVTRYFGGTKLGTGGLVRAYTSAAKAAVEHAGLHAVREVIPLQVRIEYPVLGRLQNLEKESNFEIKDIIYTDKVDVMLAFEPESKEDIMGLLANLNNGLPAIIEESFALL